MLAILSPAKTQDFNKHTVTKQYSIPTLLEESNMLVYELRKLGKIDIAQLMSVSSKIAELNFKRYKDFTLPFTESNAKQVALAFKGDVYTGLDAKSLKEEDFTYAQDHLHILSGLYGLLKPMDLIQPYRLEMKTKLQNPRGNDLYEFWGNIITEELNKALAIQGDNILINLASQEYFSAVNPKALQGEIINVVFKEFRNGEYIIIGIIAKKSRGMMARYMIKNKISFVEELKNFTEGGYHYEEKLSNDLNLIFAR